MSRIMPEDQAGQQQEHSAEDDDVDHLTEDADEPAAPNSKLGQFMLMAKSWLLGEGRPRVDMEDIREARGVTAFAKETLMPALYEATTSPTTLTAVKVLMFVGLNTLLVAVLFVYPKYNTYKYLTGDYKVVDGTAQYVLRNSSSPGRVALATLDAWGAAAPEGNAQQLAEYQGLISLPFDAVGDPGWNLQDLLDLPRVQDAELACSSAAAGGRMVQDYRRCSTGCLDASGQPADAGSRDTSVVPYGQFGDYYVRRDLVLAAIDPNFYQQLLNSSTTDALRAARANHGLDLTDAAAAAAAASQLGSSMPTDSGYLCSLGQPRRQLTAIQIFSKACYVKIVSAPGDGYELYLRTRKEGSVAASVSETETTNATSGCITYTLDITAQAEDCSRPQLPGVDPGCEASCAVVLFKGVNARRLPIRILESPIAGAWPSTLHINDKYLVLDQGPMTGREADLAVTGGSIAVNISAARIGSLTVQNTAGVVTLDHARIDSAVINSTNDNIIIEDDRDTELQYRSGGNLLCAAAPLVEAVPDVLLGCGSNSSSAANATAAGRPRPHEWYESTQDGFIDRDEFAAGLARMGLSYSSSSLGLDEQQQAQLLELLFRDAAAGPASDRVTHDVFDANLAAARGLDFMADTYMLLDPWCYNSRLLKVRPAYTPGATDTAAQIAAAAMQLATDGSGTVLDTRMPLYPTSSANPSSTNPCPPDWGSGLQGSTNYSHFAWANASLGYKWGKALPAWCLDEAYPGVYPAEPALYGGLAGQPVLPGCEPVACKALYRVAAQASSIHVQVLPYTHDAWNATGSYQTMLSSCEDADGQLRCFYKGWPDDADASLHPQDAADWAALMDPCYADSLDCSDNVHAVTVAGHGSPGHQKWFWSSRKVYMELEPAWYMVMSASLLKPDVSQVQLRLSPGYCSPALGAVEHIDWRHPGLYDALPAAASGSTASGVTHLKSPAAGSAGDSVRRDPRDAVLAQQGLRAERGRQIYARLQESINGTAPDRSGWFLKQSIRQDYRNESLVLSAVVADGLLDTSPGHADAAGRLQGAGPGFRHRRVCVPGRSCEYEYIIHRDNCRVPRTASLDPNSSKPLLSPCTFPDGNPAWLQPHLGEASATINDTAYFAQFPLPAEEYSLQQLHGLGGDGLLQQAQLADANTHAWGNVTQSEYSKWMLQVADNGDLQLVDATDGWKAHTPLYLAIVLSLVIAVLCALLVVGMLVLKGLDLLAAVNKDLQARAKIELAVLEERKAAMLGEVLEAKRLMAAEARRAAGAQPGTAAAVRRSSKPDQLQSRAGVGSAAGGADATKASAAGAAVAGDVFLTEPEKTEILRVWESKDISMRDFRSWDKQQLVAAWREEVLARAAAGRLSLADPSLLPSNQLPAGGRVGRLQAMMTFHKHRADIAVHDAGPRRPTRSKTLDATELAADRCKLLKLESKIRYEQDRQQLQQQFSTRRSSKEAQALLAGSSSSTADGKPAAAAAAVAKPAWRQQLEQVAAVNLLRARRLVEKVVEAGMISLPSPFQVINCAVMEAFEGLWVDSLATFLRVKCLFDHDMAPQEEMLFGCCEKARQELRLGMKPISQQPKRSSVNGAAASSSAAGATATASGSAAGGKAGASNSSSGQSSSQQGSDATLIEIDGDGDVVACQAVDGKNEVYRTQYVRLTLRGRRVEVLPSEDDSDTDSDSDDNDEDVQDSAGAGSHGGAVVCSISVGAGGAAAASQQGGKGSSKQAGGHHLGFGPLMSKGLNKTFARVAAFVGADDEGDGVDGEGSRLLKPRRRWQWELLVQEGPGVVCSSRYNPEEEHTQGMMLQSTGGAAAAAQGAASQLFKPFPARTLCLPCPSRRELREAEAAGKAGPGDPLRVRHYLVKTKSGRCVVSINTLADAAAAGGKAWLKGGRHMAPRVQFSMPLATFAPEYEKFCMQNDLQAKDVLASTAVLSSSSISLKKRIVSVVKGLKQKPTSTDSLEEQMALQECSLQVLPGPGPAAAVGYDASEDRPLQRPRSPPSGQLLSVGGQREPAMRPSWAGHHQLPPLPPGSVPSFQGQAQHHQPAAAGSGELGDEAEFEQQLAAASGSGSEQQQEQQPLLQPQQRQTWADGDSSDEEEALDQLHTLRRMSNAVAGAGSSVAGGVGRAGSRRGTVANAPAVTTAEEARKASRAGKKLPSTKLQELLAHSSEPVAVFLRETYDVTANFVSDEVDLEVMQRQFKRWQRAQAAAAGLSHAGGAVSRAGAAGSGLSGAGGLARPEASTAALQMQQGPRLAASLAGAAGLVAAEASSLGLQAAAAAAGQQANAVAPAAVKRPLSGEEVAAFGFKFVQQPEHTMFGVLMDQQDFSDDPRDANRLVYLAADLLAVLLHTLFIWLLPMPLFVIVFGFQGHFNATTSIQPLLTIDEFRRHPLAHLALEFYPLLKAMVWAGIVWVAFCYVKLLMHYLLAKYEDRPWRALPKTLFWAYLTLMVGVLVAYLFEVFCWVVLGAVINPNKFLPYSVAAITLVAHSRSTWGRLIAKFNSCRESLSSSVLAAFAEKISAAEEATAQTDALLQDKLAEAAESADAAAAVRAAASLSGAAGGDEEGGADESGGNSALAALMGVGVGAVGAGMAGALAGTAVAAKPALGLGMWPRMRRSSAADDEDGGDERAAAGRQQRGGGKGSSSSGGGLAAAPAAGSAGPSQQASQVWRGSAAGGAAAGAARRMSSSSTSGGSGKRQAAAAPAAAGGGSNGSAPAAAAAGGGKGGDPLECYSMFKMFAADDDSLDYSEFCALLEHLDIRLLEDKRRKLFARIDKSADGHIGYQEFQEGFELLKAQIVERHMAKAGVTLGRLIALLVYAVVVLLLVFVFIFLGVAAFTGANSMGAVVNSCMTAGAGIAMNLGGGEEEEEEAEEVDISDA